MTKDRLNLIIDRYKQSRDNLTHNVEDDIAVESVYIFPSYEECVRKNLTVESGFRFRYGDKLYKVMQPYLVFDGVYAPGLGTESLFAEVTVGAQGDSIDNPIPYSGNMELFEGKYYSQDGVTYVCIRDSGIPLYNNLTDLIENYVRVAV